MNNYIEISIDCIHENGEVCWPELKKFILHNAKNKYSFVQPCNVYKDINIIVNSIKSLAELAKSYLKQVIQHEDLSCESIDLLCKTGMNITQIVDSVISYFNLKETFGKVGKVDLRQYVSEFYNKICSEYPVNLCCNIYIKNNIPKGTTVILNCKILTQILANIIILIYLSNSESNSRISILANYIKKVDTNTIAITIIDYLDVENLSLEKTGNYLSYSKSERLTICANLARNIDGKLLTAKVKGRGRAYILLLDV